MILDSHLARSLYIWIFIIPVFAKVALNLPPEIEIRSDYLSEVIPLNFSIPLSWKCLYYSGVLIFFARIIFVVYCPNFVREHGTAASAIASGVTAQRIRSIAADFLRSAYKKSLPDYESNQGYKIRTLLKQYRANVDDLDLSWMNKADISHAGELLFDSLESVRFSDNSSGRYEFHSFGTYNDVMFDSANSIEKDQLIKHLCWDLIHLQNSSYRTWRLIASFLVGFSFLLLSIPFVQGIWFVYGITF